MNNKQQYKEMKESLPSNEAILPDSLNQLLCAV